MSVLDLQGMRAPEPKGPPAGSRTSKGCGNSSGSTVQSNVSLILCTVTL